MEFEWDETKRALNLAKHGLDFGDVTSFAWDQAIIRPDSRYDYGEERFHAFAMQAGRLIQVTFTRRGSVTRIVSFRYASRKERRLYDR